MRAAPPQRIPRRRARHMRDGRPPRAAACTSGEPASGHFHSTQPWTCQHCTPACIWRLWQGGARCHIHGVRKSESCRAPRYDWRRGCRLTSRSRSAAARHRPHTPSPPPARAARPAAAGCRDCRRWRRCAENLFLQRRPALSRVLPAPASDAATRAAPCPAAAAAAAARRSYSDAPTAPAPPRRCEPAAPPRSPLPRLRRLAEGLRRTGRKAHERASPAAKLKQSCEVPQQPPLVPVEAVVPVQMIMMRKWRRRSAPRHRRPGTPSAAGHAKLPHAVAQTEKAPEHEVFTPVSTLPGSAPSSGGQGSRKEAQVPPATRSTSPRRRLRRRARGRGDTTPAAHVTRRTFLPLTCGTASLYMSNGMCLLLSRYAAAARAGEQRGRCGCGVSPILGHGLCSTGSAP